MMQTKRHLTCLLITSIITAPFGRVIPPEQTGVDCEGYRSFLTRILVQFGATYFADHPRLNNNQLDPNEINPLTPSELFRVFYGSAATPRHFVEAILEMYYSDPGPDGPSLEDSDKIVLRNNIYTYAKANSYELAREKFGLLLYLGITDYAEDSVDWLSRRCLRGKERSVNAEDVINSELERLRNEIGEFKFGAFLELGSGTTLAFVIDNTGSMAGEIEAAKQRANQIIDERQGSLDQPQNFVLVPFNDPTVGPLTTTSNPSVFKQAIANLYAYGGGDAAELALRGILLAVENSRHGSVVFVMTDIDAKDIDLQDVVVGLAKQKNIKIIFLLTGKIPTTQCRFFRSTNDEVENRRCLTNSFKKGRDLYDYIAENTGGDVLSVSKNNIFKATEVVDSFVRQGVVTVDYRVVTGRTSMLPIQVDSSIREIFIRTTRGCKDLSIEFDHASLAITDSVSVADWFEAKVKVDSNFGRWIISLRAESPCQVEIQGRSTKGFIVSLGKEKRLDTGENILELFQGQPLLSDSIALLLDSFGKVPGDRATSLEFIDQYTGRVLTTSSIPNPGGNTHMLPVSSNPSDPFYVRIRGRDANGFLFTRMSSSPIQFIDVQLDCENIENVPFRPGERVAIILTINNNGNDSARFELNVTDTRKYVTNGVLPSNLTINGSEKKSAVFRVVLRKEDVGITSVITITAKSSGLPYLLYKTCRVVVGQRLRPIVESLSVDASISSRFAQTTVTSVVYNNATISREAEFQTLLPADAFVTGFSMTIDDVTYHARIEERRRAERKFTAAKERDLTAGLVVARDLSTTIFRNSVNLQSFKRVTFRFTYQELLQRENRSYSYGVSIVTFQPVQQFSIDISICESDEIIDVSALGFDTEQSSISSPIAVAGVSLRKDGNTAQVSYNPSSADQTQFSPFGLNGRFAIKYQLSSAAEASELLISKTNFVYFASPNIDPMPKRVIFALDVSGSMFGHKYRQLKLAMFDILDNLLHTDEFSIILFNNSILRWIPEGAPGVLAPASHRFISQAKTFLNSITTQGSTDILLALQTAIQLLSEAVNDTPKTNYKPLGGISESNPVADFIILITDGRSTDGTTKRNQITRKVVEVNRERFGIHTIGLGTLVDAGTLRLIADQNSGRYVRIFIDVDTHAQLTNFFNLIARPVFHDVSIEYPDDRVTEAVETKFPFYFDGQELISSGRLASTELLRKPWPIRIRGYSRNEETFVTASLNPRTFNQLCEAEDFQVYDFVERLQVFQRIKNALSQYRATSNREDKDSLRGRILAQALQYRLVVPGITSLIVLKPRDRAMIEKAMTEVKINMSSSSDVISEADLPSVTKEEREETDTFTSSPTPKSAITIPRPTVPTSHMRIFGDPHFFVEFRKQIPVCFNWHGNNNEIYNILRDEVTSIIVNAKLVGTTFSENPKTFIGEIGLIFPRKKMSAKVDVSRIVVRVGSSKPMVLQLTREGVIKKRGVSFKVIPISITSSVIVIGLNDVHLNFQILSRVHSTNVDILNHLEFSVPNSRGFSKNLDGLLGQFQQNKRRTQVSIRFLANKKKAILSYRHNMILVRRHTMYDIFSRRMTYCWYVNDLRELTGDHNKMYLRSNLLDEGQQFRLN